MPAMDTLLTFSLAALLLSLSPGPSNLYIMARTIGQGAKAGVAAASGMAAGSFLYVMATALGIAAIFKYSPLAYTLIKIAGAVYLIYLGTQYLLASTADHTEKPHIKPLDIPRIFRQSIIVELTNPKTALFFLAFLPQFVDPQIGNVVMQLIILGTVYALIALSSDLMVVTISKGLGTWLAKHPLFIRWQDRISGSLLVGLGSYIAYEEWAERSS